MNSILDIIEANYKNLTNSEKKVADYFLERKYDVALQSLLEISENTGVGEATVVRFCHRLGCKSFLETKLMLDYEKAEKTRNQANGYIATIEDKVINSIKKSSEMINIEELSQAVKWIDECEPIMIVGVAMSGLSAQAMATRFIRAGKLCHFLVDAHLQSSYASWADSHGLLIVFSLSGRTKDTIETMKLAKQNGVRTIAITNFKSSPVAKLADIVLNTVSLEGPINNGNLAAMINQIFIADLLITGYVLLDEERSLGVRKAVYKAISTKLLE